MSGAAGTSYTTKAINITIQKGKGSFGLGGFDTIKLPSGLRTVCTIQKLGYPAMDRATVQIYGVAQNVMNEVTSLGIIIPYARDNQIIIEAGDVGGAMAVVHQGAIDSAWQDLDGMPDTYLSVSSFAGFFVAMKPTSPISYASPVSAATVMSGLATQAGRAFHNNGVVAVLPACYFAGTVLEQAHSVARAAGIEFYDDGATFWIWPKFGVRSAAQIPLISPASGMIGYPKYTATGMRFRTLYNPSIQFGGYIAMQSSISQANGQWYVLSLTHSLSSQLHGGPWFSDVECWRNTPPTTP